MNDQTKLLGDEIEYQILTMVSLAEILIENGSRKGSDPAPQIDESGEGALQEAIRIVGKSAHAVFCQLMNGIECQEVKP